MIDVLLAEDHNIVREGIQAVLEQDREIKVVGCTGDGLEVGPLVASLKPQVLVLDLLLPGLHGLEVLRRLCRRTTETRVVILSMYDNAAYVKRAFQLGARAYVLKDASMDVVKKAIRAVEDGRRFLSPPLDADYDLDELMQDAEEAELDPFSFLTDRECEVLQLMAEGLTLKQTASRLFISPRTVEKHRGSLMQKLNLSNQAEAVRYAVYKGLIGPPPQKAR